jgi:hypothetical protein
MNQQLSKNKVLEHDVADSGCEASRMPWDQTTVERFKLDAADISTLEEGGVVWYGDDALSLADSDE